MWLKEDFKIVLCFFFQAEDGIRDGRVTGVQTCALPILPRPAARLRGGASPRHRVWGAAARGADRPVRLLPGRGGRRDGCPVPSREAPPATGTRTRAGPARCAAARPGRGP